MILPIVGLFISQPMGAFKLTGPVIPRIAAGLVVVNAGLMALAAHRSEIKTILTRWMTAVGALSDVDRLTRVLMKHPREAFVDQATIDGQWGGASFPRHPTWGERWTNSNTSWSSCGGSEATCSSCLATVWPRSIRSTRATPQSSVRAGDSLRDGQADARGEAVARSAPCRRRLTIYGRIESPGMLEGGDVVWVDARTMLVGRGYRTNAAGIRRRCAICSGSAVEIVEVPLPHWLGPTDVMHLMSIVSPVDHDLAVSTSRLLPVPFRQWLWRGFRLIEVADEEFETMGTNVLAIAPRRCIMLSGNPRTRCARARRLRGAGV